MEQKGNMIIADYYSHWWVEGTVKFGKSTLSQISIFLFGTCFRISIGTGKGTWFAVWWNSYTCPIVPTSVIMQEISTDSQRSQ